MKRRNFLRIAGLGLIAGQPVANGLAAGAAPPDGEDSAQCTVRCAHFGGMNDVQQLEDRYIDYSMAAHAVHNQVADRLAGGDVPVELVPMYNPSQPDPEAFEAHLAGVDVYSISTVLNQASGQPAGYAGNMDYYRLLAYAHDGIGVFAAGISGEKAMKRPYHSLAHMADTALIVGEALRGQRSAYIPNDGEKYQNVSLVAENPLRQGMKVPFVHREPDITTADTPLIEHWLSCRDAMQQLRQPEELMEQYHDQMMEQRRLLLENDQYRQTLNQRAQIYLGNPMQLHGEVQESIRKRFKVDDFGEVTQLPGPAFCAPAVAGVLSVARFYEKCRENAGDPFLKSEDLVALALLSATPVTRQENGEEILHRKNSRGLLTSTRTGFGLFDPEKFMTLFGVARQKLIENPELISMPHRIVGRMRKEDSAPSESVAITINPVGAEKADTTALRVNLTFDYDNWPPDEITLVSPGGTEYVMHVTRALHPEFLKSNDYPYKFKCIGSTDQCMGDLATGEWKIKCPSAKEGFRPDAVRLTVHGVNQGSILDVMIEEKLQEQERGKMPGRG